jgi:hypothetical protein
LVLLKDRNGLSVERLRQLYEAGDAIAAMLTGLIHATMEKENTPHAAKTVREAQVAYITREKIGDEVPPL